jgi:hypothetical protein
LKANFDRLKPIAEIVKKTGTNIFNFLAFQNPFRALKLLREDVFLEPGNSPLEQKILDSNTFVASIPNYMRAMNTHCPNRTKTSYQYFITNFGMYAF